VAEISTKPYLIRALYEWCADAGFTPQLLVAVDGRTRVPPGFVKDGQIVLNISAGATRNLTLDNDWIQFSSRFGGILVVKNSNRSPTVQRVHSDRNLSPITGGTSSPTSPARFSL